MSKVSPHRKNEVHPVAVRARTVKNADQKPIDVTGHLLTFNVVDDYVFSNANVVLSANVVMSNAAAGLGYVTLTGLDLVQLDREQYNYNVINCKTITIDKLIQEYGTPELIKIDVEGGEFECLSSLTQKVKNICFEWASETNDITFKCLHYLESLGYADFAIQLQDHYNYRPQFYKDITIVKEYLNKTTPKKEWGMIWAK